jgi:hypothetical protein
MGIQSLYETVLETEPLVQWFSVRVPFEFCCVEEEGDFSGVGPFLEAEFLGTILGI